MMETSREDEPLRSRAEVEGLGGEPLDAEMARELELEEELERARRAGVRIDRKKRPS